MTLFNYFHYLALVTIFLLFLIGIIKSLQQKNLKIKVAMAFSVTIVSLFFGLFSIFMVDKYTKDVKLHNVRNKRLLSIEKIVYSGIVKNEGDFPIGKVVFEVKLVNKGHIIGRVKGSNFYTPNSLFDFLSKANTPETKPQSIVKKFVVARDLKAGASKDFRVYFNYPPYFRSVAHFTSVSGH